MIKELLMVALGGALGSSLRYGIAQWLRESVFPLGTLLVNLAGCFIIGMVLAASLKHQDFANNWRVFVAAGFCGGLTTFSAFSLEGLQMLQEQKILPYILYVGGSVLFGLAATWAGYQLLK
ncbi:MAG: fluoride efflux transporter CrcB [Bacteroidetes bacterium]|nr:fluoride efflux transporter CrcB [Bacteroidota bacterium]